MYLSRIIVTNYRALSYIDLPLEEQITVLVGENGCGKSSILNALDACLGRGLQGERFRIVVGDFHREVFDGPQARNISITIHVSDKSENSTSMGFAKLYPQLAVDGLVCFSLVIEATLFEDSSVDTVYQFINSDGELAELDDPAACLQEFRRRCPFIRIRSAALPPPGIHSATDDLIGYGPRDSVDDLMVQAYGELFEATDQVARLYLEQKHAAIDRLLNELDKYIANEPSKDIEQRLLAPGSASGTYNRFAGLLRGSGARSLAMLLFTNAMFSAGGGAPLQQDTCALLSVEDPDAYLHPLMLTAVWSLINRLPTQRIITTHSADLLTAIPLIGMRRILRTRKGQATVRAVTSGSVDHNDLRRIAYHLRVRRGNALFMRFWLLVEGETEYWLLPEVARAMQYDLRDEGVEFVEFAQCGLASLASLANQLGIHWHLLADGDRAGMHYAKTALGLAKQGLGRITVLSEIDIENCFWTHGYEQVFRQAAKDSSSSSNSGRPKDIIRKAVKKLSKPSLALALGQAMMAPGSPGVPPPLADMIRDAVYTARHGTRFVGDERVVNRKIK